MFEGQTANMDAVELGVHTHLQLLRSSSAAEHGMTWWSLCTMRR